MDSVFYKVVSLWITAVGKQTKVKQKNAFLYYYVINNETIIGQKLNYLKVLYII